MFKRVANIQRNLNYRGLINLNRLTGTRNQHTSSRKVNFQWDTIHNNKEKARQAFLFIFLSAAAASLLYWYVNGKDSVRCDSQVLIPVTELMKHNKVDDCWIAIEGGVFDVTNFLKIHPGGTERIMKYAGGDATLQFSQMHSKEVLNRMMPYIEHLGTLNGKFQEVVTEETLRIQENMKKRPGLHAIFNSSDFEYVAKQVLPMSTYYYYSTGASDEFTLRENHHAYSRVYFRPKILQDIGPPDSKTTLLGNEVDLPIYITAFAGSKYAHPLGERNLQRSAYKTNIMQMVPLLLSYSLDDFFSEVPEDQNQWFQVHFDCQEQLDKSIEIVKRIESFPNVKGLFINVDLADLGNREKDSKKRVEDEESAAELTSVANNGKAQYPRTFCWRDIEKIRNVTNLPIALKGIQRGEDVVIAAERGIKGVVISNHGGRQLDYSRPPLEVLAEARQMLKEKNLQDKIELYVDGGIRRGSDIVKALCLGAKGVGIGRPFIYAMASYGEEGVTKLIQILETEVKNNMRLLGVDKIEDLNEDLVDTTNLKFRSPVVNNRLYEGTYEGLSFPLFNELAVEA